MNVLVLDPELWYIAHNGVDVFHCAKAQIGQEISTGQPFLETFGREALFNARVQELGIGSSSSSESGV